MAVGDVMKKEVLENLFKDWTNEDFLNSFNKHLKAVKEVEDKIPEDKDCKKCPYASNGQSLGISSPCFDICDDDFSFGSDEED